MDLETLMRIQSLELRAKVVVEGFLSGLHRSPYHGFSVEFTNTASTRRGTIRGTWTGACSRVAIGIL